MSEKPLFRKVYSYLERWAKSDSRNALFFNGPRRTGKTTAAKYIGEHYFENYYLIDFSAEDARVKRCFDDLGDVDNFYNRLFFALKKPVLPPGSLLIFDEIQFCSRARQAIKQLTEDGRYRFIETGSAVSIELNSLDILLPSKERQVIFAPLDFEEFLINIGMGNIADSIKEVIRSKNYSLFSLNHDDYMRQFRTYMLIGGMPEAVEAYVESRSYWEVIENQKVILSLFNKDLETIDRRYGTHCRAMYKNFPKCLDRNSFRFQFSDMDARPNSVVSLETVDKLAESQIGYIIKKSKNPDIGLSLTEDDTYFKGFYNDLGLAHCLCYSPENIDEHYDKFIEGTLRGNFGYIYENAVAQQLVLVGLDPHYFSWVEKKGSTVASYEVDFAFERHGKVQPVECKSSGYRALKSLDILESRHKDTVRKGIVITSDPYSEKLGRQNFPFYAMFALFTPFDPE